jgi:sensor histidine kinase YesM
MNAPRFPVVDDARAPDAGPLAFARDVLGRLGRVHLAWGVAIMVGVRLVRPLEGFPGRAVPPTFWKSGLLIDTLIVTCMIVAVVAADAAVARGARRLPAYLLALVCGAGLSSALSFALLGALGWETMLSNQEPLIRITRPILVFCNNLVLGSIACCIYLYRRSARQALERMRAAEVQRARARRRTLESQLQAMQARVEPQFLFNTLAQVGELYERDPDVAGRMLDDLIAYLRAALPHLRRSSSTLGREIELARAYLDIMKVRLGARLEFAIDVPEPVKAARLPPMMLLPLIDHALVYGLQPADAHGSIRIETRAAGGRLTLQVVDSGAGFVPESRAEDLERFAERLRALYGDDARFELERMQERGTRAMLEIPYEETEEERDEP